jgi:hypothetical protein
MEQVARLRTRKELWRAALMVMGGRCGDHHRLGYGLPLEGGLLAVGFDMPLGVIDEEAAASGRGLNGPEHPLVPLGMRAVRRPFLMSTRVAASPATTRRAAAMEAAKSRL